MEFQRLKKWALTAIKNLKKMINLENNPSDISFWYIVLFVEGNDINHAYDCFRQAATSVPNTKEGS